MLRYYQLFALLVLCAISISAQQVIRIDVQVYEKAYAPATNELLVYGVLPGEDPFNQQLLVFDATSGALKRQIRIDNFVRDIAINSTGDRAYLAIASIDISVNDIAVYDLNTYQEINRFAATAPFERYTIRAIAVSPTNPDLVAVIFSQFPELTTRELVLFRNGSVWGESVGGSYAFDQVNFRSDGGAIYTKNNHTTANDLRLYQLDENEQIIPAGEENSRGIRGNAFVEINGRLFSQTSEIVDISNDTPKVIAQHSVHLTTNDGAATRAYESLLADRARQYFILLSIENGQLEAYTFDTNRLHLLEKTRTSYPEALPYNLFDEPIVPIGDGLQFAAHTANTLYLIKECTAQAAAPVFTPPLDPFIYHCQTFNNRDTFELLPPAGADAIFTEDGTRHDTLRLVEEGTYRLRVMAENGCLSKATVPFQLINATYPSTPAITNQTRFGYQAVDQAVLCADGELLLRTNYDGDAADLHWSNGQVGPTARITEPGELWIDAISPKGCKTPGQDTVNIIASGTMPPAPPDIEVPNESFSFCGQRELRLSVNEELSNYEWIAQGSSWIGNLLTLSDADAPMEVSVRGQNEEGCWSAFNTVTIERNPFPGAQPQILRQGNTLAVAQPLQTQQWFYEGSPINESDSPVWRATLSGSYQVRSKSGSCWTELSEAVDIEF